MEEKKKVKISLGTVICIVIIVLLIAALGAVYYFGVVKNNDEIKSLNKKIEKAKDENESLNKENTMLNEQILDFQLSNELKKEEQSKKDKTYNEVKGAYSGKTNLETISNDGENSYDAYNLILNEDGTYKYEHGLAASQGTIGNYIIEDNKIILNKWFETGSDIRVLATKGKIELTLNEDGTITGDSINTDKTTKVILKKDSTTTEITNDVNDLIHSEGLGNEHGLVK